MVKVTKVGPGFVAITYCFALLLSDVIATAVVLSNTELLCCSDGNGSLTYDLSVEFLFSMWLL